MKKKTLLITTAIWTAFWVFLGIMWCNELSHWSELPGYLKAQLAMFAPFVIAAYLVGLGKMWLCLKD